MNNEIIYMKFLILELNNELKLRMIVVHIGWFGKSHTC